MIPPKLRDLTETSFQTELAQTTPENFGDCGGLC